MSAPEFWSDLYTRGNDGWELRQAAPPGVHVLLRSERAYRPRSVRPRQGQEWTVLFRKTNAPA